MPLHGEIPEPLGGHVEVGIIGIVEPGAGADLLRWLGQDV